MIDEHIEVKEIHKEVVASKDYICDVCKKKFATGTLADHGKFYETTTYTDYPYRIVFSHNDWGNDSIDSIEEKHACSDECLGSIFLDFVEKYSKEYRTAEINIENFHHSC